MQAPASPHRRTPALAFFDHTPRVFEITAPFSPSQSPASLSDVAASSASMPLGAGQLYTNAIMGSTPSAEQRENVRKASSTILREDFIQVELHDQDQDDRATVDTTVCTGQEPVQRPESCRSWWSTTFDRTDQAPCTTKTDSDMNTQTSMPRLPKGNASHDLAFFLRTTGPTAPHRRPSKLNHHPGRAISVSKNAFRFLKVGQRRPPASVTNAHLE